MKNYYIGLSMTNTETKTLLDITGQESAIVIYPDNTVIVCNVSSVCPTGGMPTLSPFGTLMCWPIDEILEVVDDEHVEDIRTKFPGSVVLHGVNENDVREISVEGMDIVSDDNYDILALWGYDCGNNYINLDADGNLAPTGGHVYTLKTVSSETAIVIAPDEWS